MEEIQEYYLQLIRMYIKISYEQINNNCIRSSVGNVIKTRGKRTFL